MRRDLADEEVQGPSASFDPHIRSLPQSEAEPDSRRKESMHTSLWA